MLIYYSGGKNHDPNNPEERLSASHIMMTYVECRDDYNYQLKRFQRIVKSRKTRLRKRKDRNENC